MGNKGFKVGVILGVVAIFIIASAFAVQLTSTTEFCLSCHEMAIYQEEMLASSHAKDANGQAISCNQCHIPSGNVVRMLSAKIWMGSKDVWYHFLGGPDIVNNNLDRAHLQVSAKRFMDDKNCLACHEDLSKNAKKDAAISFEGKLAHDNYQGKNGQAKDGCVGCHRNLAHLPIFDMRIPKNQVFAEKLQLMRPANTETEDKETNNDL